jgi:acid phosphatase class B
MFMGVLFLELRSVVLKLCIFKEITYPIGSINPSMAEVSENIFGSRARTSQTIHWMSIARAAVLIQDREIIAVCIQDHTALISTLCGQMRQQVPNTVRGSPQNGRGPTAVGLWC